MEMLLLGASILDATSCSSHYPHVLPKSPLETITSRQIETSHSLIHALSSYKNEELAPVFLGQPRKSLLLSRTFIELSRSFPFQFSFFTSLILAAKSSHF